MAESLVQGWKETPQKLKAGNQRFGTDTNNLNGVDSGFISSKEFYRDGKGNKLAKNFKTLKHNTVEQEVSATKVKKFKPLFSDQIRFEEGCSQHYAKHFNLRAKIMFQGLEKSRQVKAFLANLEYINP